MGYPRALLERWDRISASLTAMGEPWTEDMIALDLELIAERGRLPGEDKAAKRWCLKSRGNSKAGSGVFEAREILRRFREEREGTGEQPKLPAERPPKHDAPAWWDVWKPARAALFLLGIELPVQVAAFDMFWHDNQRRFKGVVTPGVSELARLYGWRNGKVLARGRVDRLLDSQAWTDWEGLRKLGAMREEPREEHAERTGNTRFRKVMIDGVEVDMEPMGFSEAVDVLVPALQRLGEREMRRAVLEAEDGNMSSKRVTWAVSVLRHSGLGVSKRRTDVMRFLAAACTEIRLRLAS